MRVSQGKVGLFQLWEAWELGRVGAVGSKALASLEGWGAAVAPAGKSTWDSSEPHAPPGFTLFKREAESDRLDGRAGGRRC